jgi:hypothetical protein
MGLQTSQNILGSWRPAYSNRLTNNSWVWKTVLLHIYQATQDGAIALGGTRVDWLELEATKNCTVEGTDLIIPPNTREARFAGTTDPASHPVPANESCVSLDIRKFAPIRGGESELEPQTRGEA